MIFPISQIGINTASTIQRIKLIIPRRKKGSIIDVNKLILSLNLILYIFFISQIVTSNELDISPVLIRFKVISSNISVFEKEKLIFLPFCSKLSIIDILSKRIIAWISNSKLTYENSEDKYKNKFNTIIQKQVNHLINEIEKSKLIDEWYSFVWGIYLFAVGILNLASHTFETPVYFRNGDIR